MSCSGHTEHINNCMQKNCESKDLEEFQSELLDVLIQRLLSLKSIASSSERHAFRVGAGGATGLHVSLSAGRY